MFHFKKIVVGLLIAMLAGPVSAHSNHGGGKPVTEQQAAKRADKVIKYLVKKERLDSSWQQVSQSETSQQVTAKGKVWVVRYENADASDEAKKTLFVFVDELGNVITANHDGKL